MDTSWVHGLQNKSSDIVYILAENNFSCSVHLILHCPAGSVAVKSLERGQTTAGLLFVNLFLVYFKHSEVFRGKFTMLWCISYSAFNNCKPLSTLFHLFPLLHFFGWSILKHTYGILLFHPRNLQCTFIDDKDIPLSQLVEMSGQLIEISPPVILFQIHIKFSHFEDFFFKQLACLNQYSKICILNLLVKSFLFINNIPLLNSLFMNWFFKNIYIFFLEDAPTFWTWSVISLYFHWISSSIPWGPTIWELETGGVYFLLYSFNLKGSESLQESLHSWRVGSIFQSEHSSPLLQATCFHYFTDSLLF